MTEYYKVKNLITGFEFNLPKEDCDRLVIEEPNNFKILDDNYVAPETGEKVTTVYEQLIDEEAEEKDVETQKPFTKYSYNELKEYCKKCGLNAKGNTEELRARVIEYNTELNELLKEAEEKDVEINQNPITVDELKKLLGKEVE